jgi:hypothetical protein
MVLLTILGVGTVFHQSITALFVPAAGNETTPLPAARKPASPPAARVR